MNHSLNKEKTEELKKELEEKRLDPNPESILKKVEILRYMVKLKIKLPCLEKMELSKADLCGVDFSGVELDEANLFEALLIGVDMSRAYLVSTNFQKVNLDHERFH